LSILITTSLSTIEFDGAITDSVLDSYFALYRTGSSGDIALEDDATDPPKICEYYSIILLIKSKGGEARLTIGKSI
jgi:hypothetical protein